MEISLTPLIVYKNAVELFVVARDLAVVRAEVSNAEESQAREYAERPMLPMVSVVFLSAPLWFPLWFEKTD